MRVPIPLIFAAVVVAVGVVVFYVNFIPQVPKFVWTNVANNSVIPAIVNPNGTMPAFFIVSDVPVTIQLNNTATIYYYPLPIPVVYSPDLTSHASFSTVKYPFTFSMSTGPGGVTYYYASGAPSNYVGLSIINVASNIWAPDLCSVSFSPTDICSVFVRQGNIIFSIPQGEVGIGINIVQAGYKVVGTTAVIPPRPYETPYPDIRVYWGYVVAINATSPVQVAIYT